MGLRKMLSGRVPASVGLVYEIRAHHCKMIFATKVSWHSEFLLPKGSWDFKSECNMYSHIIHETKPEKNSSKTFCIRRTSREWFWKHCVILQLSIFLDYFKIILQHVKGSRTSGSVKPNKVGGGDDEVISELFPLGT